MASSGIWVELTLSKFLIFTFPILILFVVDQLFRLHFLLWLYFVPAAIFLVLQYYYYRPDQIPRIAKFRSFAFLDDNSAELQFSVVLFGSEIPIRLPLSLDGFEDSQANIRKEPILSKTNQEKEIQHLDQLIKRRDAVLSGISDGIKTPVNGIIGLSEVIMTGGCGEINEEVSQTVSLIKSSGAQILSVANDIVDSCNNRARDSFTIEKFQSINLESLLVKSLSRVSILKRPNVEIKMSIPYDLNRIVGDKDQITQVMTALLRNAFLHTETGSVSVSATTRIFGGEDMVEVTVEDTGLGISMESLHASFLPKESEDSRNSPSESRSTRGKVGLSLDVVREFVQGNCGNITAKSTVGKGTSFTLTLPIAKDDQVSADSGTVLDESTLYSSSLALKPEQESIQDSSANDGSTPAPHHSSLCDAQSVSLQEAPVGEELDTLKELPCNFRSCNTPSGGMDAAHANVHVCEFHTLIEKANLPMFGVDTNGNVNKWNKKATAMSKFTSKEVFGKNFVGLLIIEEFKAAIQGVLDRALSGKETEDFEFPFVTKDGNRLELLLTSTSHLNSDGEVVGVLAVALDITWRKQAEWETQMIATKMRLIIDTANAPIFVINKDGLVNEWNNKAAEITEFNKMEVMGHNLVEEFISLDYAEAVKNVMDRALCGNETVNFEFPLFNKQNGRVDVLLNATPLRDTYGSIIGVVGVGQDITERKMAEQELRRVANDLRSFIDNANAPILGTNKDGLVNEWNKKVAEITGFSKEEVMGQDLVEKFLPSGYRENVKNVLRNALMGIETAAFEFPLFSKNGKQLDIVLNANPRVDIHGDIVGVVGVGQDMTNTRLAMEAEAQLSRIRAANDAKSQFLANMSHEMRTPLNGIIGINQLLLQTELDMEQRELAVLIESSSDSLLKLINDILDLTRVESGKLELEYMDFDVAQMVEEALDSVTVLASNKGLEMICILDPKLPVMVRGDSDRLKQVLLNLLSNAIKFTSQGEVKIQVRLLESSHCDLSLEFSVSDSGIGIPKEGLGKLFARFSQVDSSTTRNYGGTGLGLAISEQLVELMTGEFKVKSKEGVGSSFTFNVKVEYPEEDVDAVEPFDLAFLDAVQLIASNFALRSNIESNLCAWKVGSVFADSSFEDAKNRLKEFPRLEVVIISVSTDAEIEAAVQLHSKFKEQSEHWMVLSPINLTGKVTGLVSTWVVLSKPVRQRALYKCLKDLVLGNSTGCKLAKIKSIEWSNSDLETGKGALGHILLVEDNHVIQEQIRKLLLSQGYLVDISGNGKEALECIERVHYDLCLMDLYMPEMDGMEATRTIRENEMSSEHLTIIGISTGNDANRDLCFEAGTDDFLRKPIKRGVLFSMVEKWIGQKFSHIGESLETESTKNSFIDHQSASELSESSFLSSWASAPNPVHVLVVEDSIVSQRPLARMLKSEGFQVTVVADGMDAVNAIKAGSRFELVLLDVNSPTIDGAMATKMIRRLLEKEARPQPHVAGMTVLGEEMHAEYLAAGMNEVLSKPLKRPTLQAWKENLWPELFKAPYEFSSQDVEIIDDIDSSVTSFSHVQRHSRESRHLKAVASKRPNRSSKSPKSHTSSSSSQNGKKCSL